MGKIYDTNTNKRKLEWLIQMQYTATEKFMRLERDVRLWHKDQFPSRLSVQFSSLQSLSCVLLFVTP